MKSEQYQMGRLGINFERKNYNSYEKLRNNKKYINGTKEKIRTQLITAYAKNHDAIVLSGFGCGAFENNWKLMSELYQEIISTDFEGVFKKIVFGIVDPKDPYKLSVDPHNDTSSHFLKLANDSNYQSNEREIPIHQATADDHHNEQKKKLRIKVLKETLLYLKVHIIDILPVKMLQ